MDILDPGKSAEGFEIDVCLRGADQKSIVCQRCGGCGYGHAMSVKIGPYTLPSNVLLAPMAGVTDRPFRILCRRFGAGLAASEMLSADVRLWDTPKSRRRMDHSGEPSPRVVQIAGFDPSMMADAARRNVDAGAQIIDINMGCPAKKVCNRLAGSALLQDEALVARILHSVVRAVAAPVTLKTRTGWDPHHKNGIRIAKIAEDSGIQALAIHGRTRTDMYQGNAEHETVAAIKALVRIPVFANGDIDSPQRARRNSRRNGMRRHHDRPSGARPAMDFRRSQFFSRDRPKSRSASAGKSP